MIESKKNYWLYISSHVYCCIKNYQVLLYNTQTGERIESVDNDILILLQSLHEMKNLGCVYCEGKMLSMSPYLEFVDEFCRKKMGNIIDIEQMKEKPIQLMPILNLQHDIDKLQKNDSRSIGENLLKYLLELNIYLNTSCKQNCSLCNNYFRQSLCCFTNINENQKELDVSVLKNILFQIKYSTTSKINLLGGNTLEYSYYEGLPALLKDFKGEVHIWVHYANFINEKKIINNFFYDVIVTFPIKNHLWNNCIKLLKGLPIRYHFYIVDSTEYEEVELMVKENTINNYYIHPITTKLNNEFFKIYVYTEREDIFEIIHPFHRIFAHQKLNTHSFGSLTILVDGEVYANIINSSIGNINNDELLNIIKNEMITNTAWRKIRDMKPCTDCLYQFLCSSPSNYEIAIGKSNLCHIKD